MEESHASSPPDWQALTFASAVEEMANGSMDAVDLCSRTLAMMSTCQRNMNAFTVISESNATSAAEESRRRWVLDSSRPLEGLPIAVKDMIDTVDMPTQYGSSAYANHIPAADARVVRQLREAGAVIVGKTTTHEFAWGVTTSSPMFGRTLNPSAPFRIPGGSSGGAAAAVASGCLGASLGTDTGGSVRIPAALCGAVGFKPSFNAFSASGIFPLSPSLDHPGIVASNVGNIRMIAEVLGNFGMPSRSRERIGLIPDIAPLSLDPHVALAFSEATRRLTCGYQCMEVSDPTIFAGAFAAFATIVLVEGASIHFSRNDEETIRTRYSPETRERLKASLQVNIGEYARAHSVRRELVIKLKAVMEDVEYLVLPTCPCVAPMIGEGEVRIGNWIGSVREALMTFTAPFNLAGLPAVSIPIHEAGTLPVGLQIVGQAGQDAALLQFAESVQGVLRG